MATLKAEIYRSWKDEHPDGTCEDFDAEWGLVTAIFGK